MTMKSLVLTIQKGGQGKTFLTCNLALISFLRRGLRVAVIDLDTQGNASFTLDKYASNITASAFFSSDSDGFEGKLSKIVNERESGGSIVLFPADQFLADLDKVEPGLAATRFQKHFNMLKSHFDVCFIDTPPSLGIGMTSALASANFMVSPIELEQYSLAGVDKMLKVVTNIRRFNPSLQFLGMLPNKVDHRKPRHGQNLKFLRENFGSYVFPLEICCRDSFSEALGSKTPIWQVKKTAARKAANEMFAVEEHIFKQMGMGI